MSVKPKTVTFLISLIVLLSAVGSVYAQKSAVEPRSTSPRMKDDPAKAREEIAKSISEVEVTVTISKGEFRLGEMVPVDIGVENTTSAPVEVGRNPCIKVTSKKDNAYKLYAPPRDLFTLDGLEIPLTLKPKEMHLAHESILWNHAPQVSHLNEDAASSEIKDRILSEYVFTESGEYLMKGCMAVHSNKSWKVVDSDPIEVTITDPVDEDLEAWKLLRQNAHIGYFMQVGDVPITFLYKTEERESLLMEINSILEKYPNSLYSSQLRQSLDKFRAKETQRQELLKKMRRPNN